MAKARERKAGAPFEVGFKKPPLSGRFVKGRSGNPSGKKLGPVEDIRAVAETVLSERTYVLFAGKKIRVSKLEQSYYQQAAQALNGNWKAMRAILRQAKLSGLLSQADTDRGLVELTEPSGENGRIIRAYRAEQATLKAILGRT